VDCNEAREVHLGQSEADEAEELHHLERSMERTRTYMFISLVSSRRKLFYPSLSLRFPRNDAKKTHLP
jgi:hypothetical protein